MGITGRMLLSLWDSKRQSRFTVQASWLKIKLLSYPHIIRPIWGLNLKKIFPVQERRKKKSI